MLAIMFMAITLNVTNGEVYAPRVDATCYSSNFHLGTGNLPVGSNGPSTTIVNEWAVLVREHSMPLAWIAKTASSKYWIQANGKASATFYRAFPPETARWLLETPSSDPFESFGYPRQIRDLDEYAGQFRSVGGVITSCFSCDLPKRYY